MTLTQSPALVPQLSSRSNFVVMLSQVPGIRPSGEQSQPSLPSYGWDFAASSALFSGIHNVTDTEVGSADFAAGAAAAASRALCAVADAALLRRVLLPTGQLQRRAPQHPTLESRATCRHRGLSKVTSPPARSKHDCTYLQI